MSALTGQQGTRKRATITGPHSPLGSDPRELELPTAIITGPPWPRSGTARVMQNQVDYYRDRGFRTILISVPVHCSFTEDHVDWPRLEKEMAELGADHVCAAKIDRRRFAVEKYKAWVKHGFRGTALDWILFTSKTARLSAHDQALIAAATVRVVHVNHVFTLGFARQLIREAVASRRRVPIILDTHDIQGRALQEREEINPWTHRHDALDRLLDAEIRHLRKADVLVHLSLDDMEFFQSRLGGTAHVLALPTIDKEFVKAYKQGREAAGPPIDIVFVGQSTAPNTAAVRWFFEQVWPLIKDRGFQVRVVGGIETQVRAELSSLYQEFRSCFVGPVADLVPYYRAARCVIAPMVSGTGISMKTIEAMALGKAFVGTPKAYRGMPMDLIEDAGLRAYEAPQEFAQAILAVLSDPEAAAKASERVYDRLFSERVSFAARDQALRLVGALDGSTASMASAHEKLPSSLQEVNR